MNRETSQFADSNLLKIIFKNVKYELFKYFISPQNMSVPDQNVKLKKRAGAAPV